MAETLAHRGPDDAGVRVDERAGLGLAHRRLSIIDLSERGRQPMEREGCWIAYNGEVYNYRELRGELERIGYSFHSTSDTEVVLVGYLAWGEEVLQRMRGMFAGAIWDGRRRLLVIFRDRVGVKPLYYWRDPHRLIVASQPRAIVAHPAVAREIDPRALAAFLELGYVPAPLAIFRGMAKLPAAHYAVVGEDLEVRPKPYWDPFASPPELPEDPDEREGLLEEKLLESFELRMVADVEVGIFLSGGIDSSLVAALLARRAGRRVRAFTIGFEERRYDESEAARLVARHLDLPHHVRMCTEAEALELVEDLPEVFDEPFGDASAIPTLMLSRFARERVKVALSADGGDELFAGYRRYRWATTLWTLLGRIGPGRPVLSRLFRAVPAGWVGRAGSAVLPDSLAWSAENKWRKLQTAFATAPAFDRFWRAVMGYWTPEEIEGLLGSSAGDLPGFVPPPGLDGVDAMAAVDYRTYLPDDVLVKVDRATMAASLEGRDPLLDHGIAEMVFALPREDRYRDGRGKILLKRILERYVPREIVERPKHGFAVPMERWLSGALEPLLRRALDRERLRREGVLRWEPVAAELRAFERDRRDAVNHAARLWLLVVFQRWKERWLDR
jgi:asparagine synthase (glutamine-hydrolysing)